MHILVYVRDSRMPSFLQGRSSLTAAHRYCGTENSIEYNSQYKVVDMRFKTNEAIEKSGFEFTAQTVEGALSQIYFRIHFFKLFRG